MNAREVVVIKPKNTAIRLKHLMSLHGYKQIDILNLCKPYCEQYGVKMNKSDISQYVSGKVEPNQDKLFVLGNALNVSEAWLMGYDVPMERQNSSNNPSADSHVVEQDTEYAENIGLTDKDRRDISKKLEETLDLLGNSTDGLMFDGEPLDDETRELLRASLQNQLEMTKRIAKQKFTPKKYRK